MNGPSYEDIEKKEKDLELRLLNLQKLEEEIKNKEKKVKAKEKEKKQVLLRLAPSLWEELAAVAEDDFRSINSEIEFLLAESVRKRKKR